MTEVTKKYRLVKQIGDLKKGTVLELRGCVYVYGSTTFEARSVWTDTEYFEKIS